ncbi:GMP synthase [Paracoccus sp. 1_MG-2023]|uniref:endonuclease/exonuclease/phosphatase family protein n=1 Tax=unclassified Paracoccus (in: a-proteobacteria) TaxID=2688777 RepID=UPI001C08ED5C|nr:MULTISPECIES: endonuclease/exonuclease/phosphatase family protein [unclassified Paracoccus (in: a-proteobacteria)]MBU2958007.1 GMP synthase [Paracoccus sp. C2R09]MDO6668799.1 GMP synthase [Paracoccus sp. 1_MG-2023]
MASFQHMTARVAVWNIAGYLDISDERLANQVEGLAILDAELVTLVEVRPFGHMQRLIDGLAAKGCTYRAAMLAQTSDLNIGLLFKEGVEVDNLRFVPGSDLDDPRRRKAMVADVTIGKFDFTLIAVHLKSGRDGPDQRIRDAQCQVIGAFIADLRARSREDVLLLGDFNMIPGEDVSNFHHLGGDDRMNFVSSWDLQDRFSHILPKGRANLLDGFAISRTFSTEYIRGSLRLFPMHWTLDMGREGFREKVSDHLPFVASFRIDRSRD